MPDVHISWLAGRTVDQKRKVVEGITKVLMEEAGAKPESTHIVFVDIPHTDFASGGMLVADKNKTSLAAETKELREGYAALNRNDIPAFVKVFDPQIERTEPAEFPGGGTYHGLAAVEAHLSQSRGTWAEGSCEPERFIVAGDRLIVFVYVRVRLKHETEWREGRIADVYTFRNGKAIQFRTFADRRQALEWAGVKASDAN